MRCGHPAIGLTIVLVTNVPVCASKQREHAPARYLIAPTIKSEK